MFESRRRPTQSRVDLAKALARRYDVNIDPNNQAIVTAKTRSYPSRFRLQDKRFDQEHYVKSFLQ